jgi:hypothetical protein
MVSKYDKNCDFCGCVVENKKGIQKEFVTRNFGDEKNQKIRRVCKTCDNRNKEMYSKQ